MSKGPPTIARAIRSALLTSGPAAKVFAARYVAREWRLGRLEFAFDVPMPDRPARPERPELLAPRKMPRRSKAGSQGSRIALWHALAHIEFVAIDLALDIVGRFGAGMKRDFADDFLSVAADEAMHFALLDRKLRSLGSQYGALPAHGGLWQAAEEISHDVAARLAIVPMVLEARGLDVTPQTIEWVKSQGDCNGARILERILDDEIRHVGFGTKHFIGHCEAAGITPQNLWQCLVKKHFRGAIKPPFNDSARFAGGLSLDFYQSLAS
ncbi:ferritin-like domain-containing protein [Parerythrobacter lacustris]|uniref:Ferritin-like domain-containing protein n=1 Tax=Parerythrobacter lacustris TaxID=2969984 RepID=A0ABT1XND1_9SPHN|nr:ferritin-like domain-containing protein [Parerythrobacter lacustris]MCR2832441.1 ferritin-like domain-containing protein [Parerythrobacter lacustris]